MTSDVLMLSKVRNFGSGSGADQERIGSRSHLTCLSKSEAQNREWIGSGLGVDWEWIGSGLGVDWEWIRSGSGADPLP